MTDPFIPLSDFCNVVQGGRHSLSGNDFVAQGFPAYGAGGINGYLPNYEFEGPAVVLSAIGARCGKCFYADGKWISLANTQVILPDLSRADPRFLWFQLNDERRWHRSGTGQPFIKPSDVKNHRVMLPSLPEQRRITRILDRADALLTRRVHGLSELDRLTRSTFVAMFGDAASDSRLWPLVTLGSIIVDGPQNGLYKPASEYGAGTPILRIDGFYDGVVTKLDSLKRVRLTPAERRLYGLHPGDIVINRVNSREFVGKSALIPSLREPTVFESNMMRFRVDSDRADPAYLVAFLQTGFIRRQIEQGMKDAINQSSINQTDVKSFVVKLPPLHLQREFVTAAKAVESLRPAMSASASALRELFYSIKVRAFGGQL